MNKEMDIISQLLTLILQTKATLHFVEEELKMKHFKIYF